MKIVDDFFKSKNEPLRKEIQSLKRQNTKLSKTVSQISVVEKDDSFDDSKWNVISSLNQSVVGNPATKQYIKEYLDWTYANISRIAIAVSGIPIKLMRLKGQDVDEVDTHPFLDLYYRPNPFMPHSDFIRLLVIYLLSSGEGPIRLKRKNPKNYKEIPSEMWLERPDNVVVKVGKTSDGFELLTGFEINSGTDKIKLNPWEMIFINNPNPQDIWRGIGAVEAAARTIATQNAAENWNFNFFQNSARPDYVLYTDQKLDDKVIERLKNKINENQGGTKNAHKPMVLEAGLKIEKITNTMKDLDFIQGMEYNRDKQMAIMGTTKALLGYTDANRASMEGSEYIFMKYTVKPLMNQIVEYLNEFLLPVFDKKGDLFLTFDDPTPQNTAEINSELNLLTNKVYSINEARNIKGLPPVEGGDIIYQPISLQPMGSEMPSAQNTVQLSVKPVYKSAKYKDQIIRLNNRNLRRKEMVAEIKLAIKSVLKSDIQDKRRTTKYKNIKHKNTTDLYVKEILKKQDKFIPKLTAEMVKVYESQLKQVIQKIGKKGKAADEYLFDKKLSVKTGIDLMTPIIESIIVEQGSEAFDLLGLTRPYNMMDEARKYLNSKPLKAAKSMTDTAYERIRKSLAEGIGKGESVPELTKIVRAEYDSLKMYQAENIARSETARATGFAQVDAYIQSGVVEGKEWLVTEDDRLCEYCLAMESSYDSKLGLNDSFFKVGDSVIGVDGGVMQLDYSDVDAPPLHPGCRCTILPVLEQIKKIDPKKKEVKVKNPDELLEEVERELDNIRKAK